MVDDLIRLHRQPRAFRVYRYAGSSAPVAFMAILRLEAPLPEDRAADPVIAALWDYVEAAAPLGQGEHLAIRRLAVQPGWHQRPSPPMDLISRRTIADEMRTRGRAITFTVFEDAQRWRRYLANAGLYAPVAALAGVPSAGGSADELGDDLPRAAFEEGVVEALRTWRAPREFATSVLLHSRLVRQGSADPVADLRSAITTALDALQVDPAGVSPRGSHRHVHLGFAHP
ncbi:UNVERIFIED_ORG: hypothetical protein FHR35_007248 [Microbispora rosea subsp. rosea]